MTSTTTTPVLLLNATYEPIRVISWQKAITLVLLGKSEMLARQDRDIRTPHTSYPMPSVIRLVRRVRVPRKPVQFSRTNIYRRDGYMCQYCEVSFPPASLTFDHVMPRSRGGDTSWLNIVTSCQECNRVKGNRTPDEASMPLAREPKEPRWSPFTLGGASHESNHPERWRPYLWS